MGFDGVRGNPSIPQKGIVRSECISERAVEAGLGARRQIASRWLLSDEKNQDIQTVRWSQHQIEPHSLRQWVDALIPGAQSGGEGRGGDYSALFDYEGVYTPESPWKRTIEIECVSMILGGQFIVIDTEISPITMIWGVVSIDIVIWILSALRAPFSSLTIS